MQLLQALFMELSRVSDVQSAMRVTNLTIQATGAHACMRADYPSARALQTDFDWWINFWEIFHSRNTLFSTAGVMQEKLWRLCQSSMDRLEPIHD